MTQHLAVGTLEQWFTKPLKSAAFNTIIIPLTTMSQIIDHIFEKF